MKEAQIVVHLHTVVPAACVGAGCADAAGFLTGSWARLVLQLPQLLQFLFGS
jgi:hypothetical protein